MNVPHRRTRRGPVDPPGSTIVPMTMTNRRSRNVNSRPLPQQPKPKWWKSTLWSTTISSQPRTRRRKKNEHIYYAAGACILAVIALIEIKVLYQLIVGGSSLQGEIYKHDGHHNPSSEERDVHDSFAVPQRHDERGSALRKRSFDNKPHEDVAATTKNRNGRSTDRKNGKDSIQSKTNNMGLREGNSNTDQHHKHKAASNNTKLVPNRHSINHTNTKDGGSSKTTTGKVKEKEITKRWNMQNKRNYTERETTQRILFLVGPHKTGSSTFQTIATHMTNVLSQHIDGTGWALSDPWPDPEHMKDVIQLGNAKHFAALIFPLIGQESHPLFVNPPVNAQSMIDLFRSDIHEKWYSDRKLNIVMGSEEVDQILPDHLDGQQVLDSILSILPPNTQNVTEIVVTYRSPKSKHLISLWKEVGVQMWNETLKDFIFNPESINHIHTIEPLGLSSMFLKRGFKVILVDIGGLKKNNVEGFQLVGCDLMKERCTDNGIMEELKPALKLHPALMGLLKESVNIRTDGVIDIDDNQIDKIEIAMKQYDCSFKDALLGNNNLTILYDANFVTNMNSCEDNPEVPIENRRVLWNNIKMIADPERAREERKKRIVLFAGPHFTSTELMHIISIHFSAISGRWTWVAPPPIEKYFNLTEPAYFASLMFAMSGQTRHPLFTKKITKELIYDIFKEDIAERFQSEKNLLLGSEELDRLSSPYFNGDDMLADLMSLLKPDEKSVWSQYEVTVVIGYNSPRIEHLLSLWKEVAWPSGKSVYDFTREKESIRHLHTIDPLFLADMFLNKANVKVMLIDIAGRHKAGLKSYQTLACHIMFDECDANNDPLFMDEHRKIHPDIMEALLIDPTNTTGKSEAIRLSTNLPKKQLDEIDHLLRRYDCNYHNILKHDNLTVLYDTAFTANMNECNKSKPLSREDMWTVISWWADPIHDLKASLKASWMKHTK